MRKVNNRRSRCSWLWAHGDPAIRFRFGVARDELRVDAAGSIRNYPLVRSP